MPRQGNVTPKPSEQAIAGIPVLSLWQPHASLCVIINPATGLPWKTIETRSWSTKYRGPLAIHAARRIARMGEARDAWAALPSGTYEATRSTENPTRFPEEGQVCDSLPLGAIIATCTLVDVVPIVDGACGPGHAVLQVHPDCLLGDDPFGDPRINRNFTDQRPYGDFTPGCYAWLLADVVPVDPPVPFKGGQGLTKRWAP